MVAHDPNGLIKLTLSGTAVQWQELVTFCDNQGIHRVVRPFLDQILQQANAPQASEAVPDADMKDKPSPGGRGRWQKSAEEATAAE